MPNHRLMQSAAAGSGGGLYNFTSYTFELQKNTPTGIDLAEAQSTFSGQPFSNDTDLMNVTTAGYIDWTVPLDGTYEITADGATAATGGSYPGGNGARATGRFSLYQGEALRMIIGHRPAGNGGAGMTAVIFGTSMAAIEKTVDYFDINALLVAGGGGGSGSNSNAGDPGQAGTSGSTNGSNQSAGTGGFGGGSTNAYGGGGGSGFRTNGQPAWSAGSQIGFTGTYTNGFIGGSPSGGFVTTGGFGGGGAGSWTGGGGGGYSGGAGFGPADGYTYERQGGGGGGSYIATSHSRHVSSSGVTAGGNTTLWGRVTITLQ